MTTQRHRLPCPAPCHRPGSRRRQHFGQTGNAVAYLRQVAHELRRPHLLLFAEHAVERNVLVIPGNVFSSRDTHFRISFACPEDRLQQGLYTLAGMMRG